MAKPPPPEAQELLTPAEVARLFAVEPKTVTRWARDGKLSSVRTLGGHRRFPADQIRRIREQSTTETGPDATPAG